jgi:serpin B
VPKFELEWGGALNPLLSTLGMTRAFDSEQADFSGLYGHSGIYIQSVHHKAFVALDEAGTEAAAATGIVMGVRGARPSPPIPQFRADRPFLFAIQHDPTGTLLFVGRLMDPSEGA